MTNKPKKAMNDEDTVPFTYDAEACDEGTSLTRLTALQSKICSCSDWELWMFAQGISRNPKKQQERTSVCPS